MNTLNTTTDVELLSDAELEVREAAIIAHIDHLKGYLWQIDVERWSRTQFPMPASIPVMAEEYAA
ncbi:hypothetical protein [Herpetosiphon geysericola]|uniref:Uncharacterized protein n=1 Tax=Herpetosiphon geysericola TaxID=70996 RepID=A0A0P6XHN0_9CHLR|nr:hypothetical protein [Herpetosiphon geysericola]KPL83044.1 hypothetical protein SE18_19575 [Herpetosiphon geysericola]